MARLLVLLAIFLAQKCSAHMDTSGCGTTKKCIFVPPGCQEKNNCQQIFTYNTPSGDGWTEMEMFSSNENPNNNYMAVGLSEDDIMGDDYVTQCVFAGEPEVHLSYNFGKSNAAPMEGQDQTMEKENLEMIHAHKGDDGMYCNFKQKSATTKSQFLPNLDQEKIIFLARGNARKPRSISIHSLDPASPDFPFISDGKFNVGATQALSPSVNVTTISPAAPAPPITGGLSRETRFFLVKLHAALMIIGWIAMIPVAIGAARYLRDHFQNTQPGGLKMWFHIHRTLNFLAVLIILLGAFFVFFAKDFTWKGPMASSSFEYNTTPSAVHTLLGVIAIIAAVIQPIMALLRCAPEASARPIFNYTHRSLGLIAIVAAIIAILIGANAFKSLWTDPGWSFWLVVFFIVVAILSIVIAEVLSRLKRNSSSKTLDMEMRHRMRHGGFVDGPLPPGKVVEKKPLWALSLLYILFVLFAICITVALIILLFL